MNRGGAMEVPEEMVIGRDGSDDEGSGTGGGDNVTVGSWRL